MSTTKNQLTIFMLLFFLFNTGCQIGYIAKNAYEQMRLIHKQVSVEKALEDPTISEEDKRKLRLSQKAKDFALQKIKLKPTKNYSGYIQLDRPSVSYVLSAAQKWKLETYQWSYPIVGKMPYKGYFNEEDAKEEKTNLEKKNLDVYLRGVSAYSTLGWFKDPLLSSMLKSSDHDLVNTVIHEMTHTTIYIKNSADFNERMAVFVGNKGTELFYLEIEGPDSATVKKAQMENEDDRLFSQFISHELEELKKWYESLPEDQRNEDSKATRLKEIQKRFESDLQPKLQSGSYRNFPKIELNNARLLVYRTYMSDLTDFEKLYEKVNGNWEKFFDVLDGLRKSKDPAKELKEYLRTE